MANENVQPFGSITVDLADVTPVGMAAQRMPAGYFKVKVTALDRYVKDGKASARFTVVGQEGDSKDIESFIFVGLEKDENGMNIGRLKAALLSCGAPADAVARNGLQITEKAFLGKIGHIFNNPGNSNAAKGSKEYRDDRYFITPEQYAKGKATGIIPARATGSAAGAVPATGSTGVDVPPPPGGAVAATPTVPPPAAAAPAGGATLDW